MVYIIAIVIILIINFLFNLIKAIQCQRYVSLFEKWLLDSKFKKNLQEKKPYVKSLVKNANQDSFLIPISENAGFGLVRNMSVNPIDQFPNRRQDIATGILYQLSAAKGMYKTRSLSSFNPIAWIEIIIYLPSKVITYLGFNKESVGTKILNVVWWILGVIFIPIILSSYNEEISKFVRDLFM